MESGDAPGGTLQEWGPAAHARHGQYCVSLGTGCATRPSDTRTTCMARGGNPCPGTATDWVTRGCLNPAPRSVCTGSGHGGSQSGQREPFARSDHISCSHRQGERCHWGKLSTGNGAEPEPSGLAFCQWKGPRLSLRRCACVTCKVSDQIADCMIPLSADMRRMGDLRGGNEINSCQRGSLKFPLIRGATME